MSLVDFYLSRFVAYGENGPESEGLETPRPWGFTIYRTDKRKTAEDDWNMLLETIRLHVRLELLNRGREHEDNMMDPMQESIPPSEAARSAADLFQLDVRSDPFFYGKTMEELRVLYDDDSIPGGLGMNARLESPQNRLFLLVDKEVIETLRKGIFTVKCVEADYDTKLLNPPYRNPRIYRPPYHGWLIMTPRAIPGLWYSLIRGNELERSVPRTAPADSSAPWTGLEDWYKYHS